MPAAAGIGSLGGAPGGVGVASTTRLLPAATATASLGGADGGPDVASTARVMVTAAGRASLGGAVGRSYGLSSRDSSLVMLTFVKLYRDDVWPELRGALQRKVRQYHLAASGMKLRPSLRRCGSTISPRGARASSPASSWPRIEGV